jgi:hypothetical protein
LRRKNRGLETGQKTEQHEQNEGISHQASLGAGSMESSVVFASLILFDAGCGTGVYRGSDQGESGLR